MKQIAIVGLGQIGGSIVFSLRKHKAPYHITGIDISLRRLRLLEKHLDQSSSDWKAAFDSECVIVCLHYESALEFLRKAPTDSLITDVCSGKAALLRFANKRKLRFIGGHPMTGNQFEGEKGWSDTLFEDATYFLCPGNFANGKDFRNVRQLVRRLGANPLKIDAQLHDRFVSRTSHFPAFVALWLKQLGDQAPARFHGPGFRSMTRLAETSPALLHTFLQSNARNIGQSAEQFQKQLLAFISKAKMQRRKGN